MTKGDTQPRAELIVTGASELLTPDEDGRLLRIAGGAVACGGGRVLAAGPAGEVLATVDGTSAERLDASGCLLAPGLVDCHTHLVYGGSRAREYALRLTKSAEEVAAMGVPGGIGATVETTRAAGPAELIRSAGERLLRMLGHGSTTVEAKSGYALSSEGELQLLRIAHELDAASPVEVVPTFMGAHDFPPDMPRGDWLEVLRRELIPRVGADGLARFCDIYCDDGYYTVEETEAVWRAAREAGLGLKAHADAYSATAVTDLAAEMGAVSCEHLNYTTPAQMKKLATAGVAGVVLPALDFAVRHPRPFDARAMLDAGMTLALASNHCPACMCESMLFVMRLACRNHAMTPEEALTAATFGAARALGREDIGRLASGKAADMVIWRLPTLEELVYRLDYDPVVWVIKGGRVARTRG